MLPISILDSKYYTDKTSFTDFKVVEICKVVLNKIQLLHSSKYLSNKIDIFRTQNS